MTVRPVVKAVLRGALKDVRHVRAVPPGRADDLVARVYAQLERDFGVLAPPVALHSPAAPVLAAAWMLLREVLLVEGRVDRLVKEVVATEVSRANDCPYCVDVHSATVGTLPPQPGAGTAEIAAWARTSGLSRPDGEGGSAPPFAAEAAPEIFGVALVFHYINRMVHVFLDDSPVPEQAPGFLRGTILRTAAKAMRPADDRPLLPGAALGLLPPAELPAGLEWARANQSVADALARAVAAVADGAQWVPARVRERTEAVLARWDGTPPGLGLSWLDEAVEGLAADDRPAARLALLTALAPFRITDADVAAFRARYPGDRELIELTSWAALAAALRVGSRFESAYGVAPARSAN
ncbi:carboxymuconolactone decarboxylase family protein [Streptomyces sp. Da 82-17]|uniref:carboxymuconolactone decarboxylase family protein n=1 Tax=Streptomyces sp. Da 82-17 TaxID=3377116 RepID=UPI0038D45A34